MRRSAGEAPFASLLHSFMARKTVSFVASSSRQSSIGIQIGRKGLTCLGSLAANESVEHPDGFPVVE